MLFRSRKVTFCSCIYENNIMRAAVVNLNSKIVSGQKNNELKVTKAKTQLIIICQHIVTLLFLHVLVINDRTVSHKEKT